jgi:hypothetical protein
MDLQEQLEAIERDLWTNDPVVYAAILLPEALLAFPETGVIDLETAIAAIRQENVAGHRWAEVAFEDVRCLELAAGVALLSYRARARWSYAVDPITVLCGSIYVEREGAWRLAYHQQSAVEPSA